jgi:hypothetical protein
MDVGRGKGVTFSTFEARKGFPAELEWRGRGIFVAEIAVAYRGKLFQCEFHLRMVAALRHFSLKL